MHLLIRPDPSIDESLESYFLRLSQENGFERFYLLSGVIKDWLHTTDHAAAGAFPLELFRLNIFHASRSSGLRVRALQLVDRLTDGAPFRLLQLALSHSAISFGNHHKAVHRSGVDIPLCFIRTSKIPCCPDCLRESAYVRQCWHFKPYVACHRHGGRLIDSCPACGESLNYLVSELINYCQCGFDLRTASTVPAQPDEIQLSALAYGCSFESSNPLLAIGCLSARFGVLLWYQQRYLSDHEAMCDDRVLAKAIGHFAAWPDAFWGELQQMVDDALVRQTKELNHTDFVDVFGSVVADCRRIPMRNTGQNFILKDLIVFLTDLVVSHPQCRVANVGDLLLSALDSATLLSTSIEQVRRLQHEGFLPLAIRPASRNTVSPHRAVFHLRHVVELRQARMQSHHDDSSTYLPAW
ncbi:TniQ family protein [Aeromonas salmonicida]|uniref:TniQ family protein n=1 Tax=Aeromonas salmonicida TaxID=645 RepID=UPI0024A90A39|nr:TniQ family protein [Aeromonas salmonicida]MDM5134698.1 TniQ family protein [Aeromonas salmonicida]WHF42179.1 TniQ family protein [Aeromonas salmonicida]